MWSEDGGGETSDVDQPENEQRELIRLREKKREWLTKVERLKKSVGEREREREREKER